MSAQLARSPQAHSSPAHRSWVAGERILASSKVPELVTKTLKIQQTSRPDGSVRRKLRLSSNLLPLMGYAPEPGSRSSRGEHTQASSCASRRMARTRSTAGSTPTGAHARRKPSSTCSRRS